MKDKVVYECKLKDFDMCRYYGGCRFFDDVDCLESPAEKYFCDDYGSPEDPYGAVFICEKNKDCPFNFLEYDSRIKVVISGTKNSIIRKKNRGDKQ